NSFSNLSRFGNQKLRRHDHGHIKTCRGIEEANTCLPSHVREMTKVPGNEVIDLVIGSKGYVDRVGDVFAMKDAARNITICQDCDLISKFYLFQRRNQF